MINKLKHGVTCYWLESGNLAKGTILEIQSATKSTKRMAVIQTEDGSTVTKPPTDLHLLNDADIKIIKQHCERIQSEYDLIKFQVHEASNIKLKLWKIIVELKAQALGIDLYN